MARIVPGMLLSIGLIVAASVIGCSQQATPGKGVAKQEAKPGMADQEDTEIADIRKAMAELPEAERPLAEAQKNCPVGGAALGSMGMPYKVTVKGRDVYLCCEGCKESSEKDPDKYLAKLDEQAK